MLPDSGGIPTQQGFPQGRNGPPRPRGHSNGQGSLVDKLNNLNLRDDQRPKSHVDGTSRPQSGEAGHKSKFQPNGKHHPGPNGHHKKGQSLKQPAPQRVPSADEFPVLAGSVTPPKLVNGFGHLGPTAAQVLQAPPPVRKEASKESSTRGTTPEPVRNTSVKVSTRRIVNLFICDGQHVILGLEDRCEWWTRKDFTSTGANNIRRCN